MGEQSVVERAYAFVEEMFGLRHDDNTPHGELGPVAQVASPEASLTSEEAVRLDADAYTFQSVGELHLESRRHADGE